MTLQLLVATVQKEPLELAKEMNIGSDAIIVSQGGENGYRELEYKGHFLRYFAMADKGVGLNRNTALLHATADIILFADEDIVYCDDYRDKVLAAFAEHPEADMLLFNVQASEGRETYHTSEYGRVHWYNSGRYPTYSFAVKRRLVHKHNITFSLLFGGGAKYSNGEDSLFLRDCLKCGMKVYRIPVLLGKETARESTWFKGYNEKFFFDRGVLYHHLYGSLAKVMAVRWLLKHKGELCKEKSVKEAYGIVCKGIKEAKQ